MKYLLSLGLIITTLLTIPSCGSNNADKNGQTETTRSENKEDLKSVKINGKEWMAENLNTAVYSNGDTIP